MPKFFGFLLHFQIDMYFFFIGWLHHRLCQWSQGQCEVPVHTWQVLRTPSQVYPGKSCSHHIVHRLGLADMSHVMRKPVYAICEQQRPSLACASAQSEQRLYYLLPRWYNTSTCYSRIFKNLASLCSWTGRFESYQIANSEDKFSHDMAHMGVGSFCHHRKHLLEIDTCTSWFLHLM